MTTKNTETNTNIDCHACYHSKRITKCDNWMYCDYEGEDECMGCMENKITYYKIPCDEGCINKELRNNILSLLENKIIMCRENYRMSTKIMNMITEYANRIHKQKEQQNKI